MKTSLSGAFSTKALSEQESIVQKCVDEFVSEIGRRCDDGERGAKKGLNMTKWFEMVYFDILGEMAFGESFRCVESGKCAVCVVGVGSSDSLVIGKPHFWSELIVDHLYFITVADNLRQCPLIVFLARLVSPYLGKISSKHTGYIRDKVEQ